MFCTCSWCGHYSTTSLMTVSAFLWCYPDVYQPSPDVTMSVSVISCYSLMFPCPPSTMIFLIPLLILPWWLGSWYVPSLVHVHDILDLTPLSMLLGLLINIKWSSLLLMRLWDQCLVVHTLCSESNESLIILFGETCDRAGNYRCKGRIGQ